jgi:hypothetical protein
MIIGGADLISDAQPRREALSRLNTDSTCDWTKDSAAWQDLVDAGTGVHQII